DSVIVFERADRIGGLLRYGIPEFKMEKRHLDRRLALMEKEGVVFQTNAHIGVDLPVADLQRDFHAVVLAGGACAPRDLPIPGRELRGIHFAMEYLTLQNRRCEGDTVPSERFISAAGKHVVIIGGGDTGADCLGTVHRQGARSVHQFEILPLPRPPTAPRPDTPGPGGPTVSAVPPRQEGGGDRLYSVSTKRFFGDSQGRLEALEVVKVDMIREAGRVVFKEISGSEFVLPCE